MDRAAIEPPVEAHDAVPAEVLLGHGAVYVLQRASGSVLTCEQSWAKPVPGASPSMPTVYADTFVLTTYLAILVTFRP